MSQFVRAPLLKKLNKDNPLSRIEALERSRTARPSASVGALGELSDDIGEARRGNLQIRADGIASVIRLNRILLFSEQATPTVTLPEGCITGSNIVEVVLTGQLFQNTGSGQTITPRFYIGKSGSETLVTSDTALSVASGSTRRAFTYTVRASAAPQGGNYIQCDEFFQLETATAGTGAVIMKTTRSTSIVDITNLFEVNSCFMRISNGAAATFFKIYTNTVSVRILDAENPEAIHWYSQPIGSDGIDTMISAGLPTTNYESEVRVSIGEDNTAVGFTYRTLIKFSELGNFLTDPDLIGFQITEAYLYLTIELDRSSNARTFNLYRLLVDWVENQATWNIRKTATNWGTAGGQAGVDYDSTPLASCAFGAAEAVGTVKSFVFNAYGIAELQKVIDGTYAVDNGFIGIAETESNDAYMFHSSDSATPDLAPILYIIGYVPK